MVGVEKLVKKFTEHPALILRTQESVLTQEARALCVAYGSAALPGPGFDDAKLKAFQGRVEREVRQVFLTKANVSALYRIVKRRSARLAAGLLRASKAGDEAGVRRILRDAGVNIEPLNPTVHQAARVGKHRSVPKGFRGETLVSEPQARAYAKRQVSLVGLAKAGWYAAAKGLKGRVRRNIVGAGGRRRTEEIFPGSIRKLARRFPGAGGARMMSAGTRSRVEIFTNITYARNALPDGLKAAADSFAQDRLAKALAESVKQLNRRKFRVA